MSVGAPIATAQARLPRLAAMSPVTVSRSTVRHALWLGGLLVVLGGLFGMHGMDNHGGAGMDTMSHTATAAPVDDAGSLPEAMSGSVHVAAAKRPLSS